MMRFFSSAYSVVLVAVSLTPEMTSALAILVAAIFVGLVNLYVAQTSRRVAMREVAKVIAPVQAKIEEMAPVLSKVEAHVNSEKTKISAEAVAKDQQILLMREMIEEMKKAAALLAQAKSTSELVTAVGRTAAPGAAAQTPVQASVQNPVQSAPAEAPALVTKVLESIDANTAAIDVNTKKTRDDVKDLKEK